MRINGLEIETYKQYCLSEDTASLVILVQRKNVHQLQGKECLVLPTNQI